MQLSGEEDINIQSTIEQVEAFN